MQVFTDEFSWLLEGLPTYTLLHEKGMRLYNLGALKHAEQFLQLTRKTLKRASINTRLIDTPQGGLYS